MLGAEDVTRKGHTFFPKRGANKGWHSQHFLYQEQQQGQAIQEQLKVEVKAVLSP
jgi:hypothetical protein